MVCPLKYWKNTRAWPVITYHIKMLNKSYSNQDLAELTELARTLWEFDVAKKKIKRRPNVIRKKVPVQAIYRMTKEAWLKDSNIRGSSSFPFVESNFTRVLGLAEGWNISIEDRKYLENDMVLFANDGKSVLISPVSKRWWETTWFNLTSIIIGIAGLIVGIISVT